LNVTVSVYRLPGFEHECLYLRSARTAYATHVIP
jgi:hypothetical protein